MRSSFARAAAVLAVGSSCLLSGSHAHAQAPAPDSAKIEEAKKHMQAGAAFYNDPAGHKCEEAYREFRKAFELSNSANALKGMGVCSLELEHDGEAIEELSKYVEAKGDQLDPAEKTQVETDLNALKSVVAYVTINTDKPGVKISDLRTPSRGFPITNKYNASIGGKRIGIHPGSHVFTASLEGQPDQVWKVEVANGATYEHTFFDEKGKPVVAEGFGAKDLTPEPPVAKDKDDKAAGGTRPTPTSVYVFAGLTVALAVPTVIFMVGASGKNSDYKKVNGTEPAAQLTKLHDDVKSADLLADVFLGVTAASLVTTGILYLARPTKPAPRPATGLWHVTPAVGQRFNGMVLSGGF